MNIQTTQTTRWTEELDDEQIEVILRAWMVGQIATNDAHVTVSLICSQIVSATIVATLSEDT